jgi:hypothetical protein
VPQKKEVFARDGHLHETKRLFGVDAMAASVLTLEVEIAVDNAAMASPPLQTRINSAVLKEGTRQRTSFKPLDQSTAREYIAGGVIKVVVIGGGESGAAWTIAKVIRRVTDDGRYTSRYELAIQPHAAVPAGHAAACSSASCNDSNL